MFTGLDKAIAALLIGVVNIATANGVDIPAWATSEWLTALVSLLFPVVVYYIPNLQQ